MNDTKLYPIYKSRGVLKLRQPRLNDEPVTLVASFPIHGTIGHNYQMNLNHAVTMWSPLRPIDRDLHSTFIIHVGSPIEWKFFMLLFICRTQIYDHVRC